MYYRYCNHHTLLLRTVAQWCYILSARISQRNRRSKLLNCTTTVCPHAPVVQFSTCWGILSAVSAPRTTHYATNVYRRAVHKKASFARSFVSQTGQLPRDIAVLTLSASAVSSTQTLERFCSAHSQVSRYKSLTIGCLETHHTMHHSNMQ